MASPAYVHSFQSDTIPYNDGQQEPHMRGWLDLSRRTVRSPNIAWHSRYAATDIHSLSDLKVARRLILRLILENDVSVWVAKRAGKSLKWHEPRAVLVVAHLNCRNSPLSLEIVSTVGLVATHVFPPMKPNAGRQARPIAGATQERRLLAVACTPMLGPVPAPGGLAKRFLTPFLPRQCFTDLGPRLGDRVAPSSRPGGA